jgi:hypothetical protein
MSTTALDSATGLTSDGARRRLASSGANAVQDVVQDPINRALKKSWAPVPWMLEAAILLQLALGEYVEASAIAFPLVFNAGLGFFQEGRAQATLEALKSRLAVTACYLRRLRSFRGYRRRLSRLTVEGIGFRDSQDPEPTFELPPLRCQQLTSGLSRSRPTAARGSPLSARAGPCQSRANALVETTVSDRKTTAADSAVEPPRKNLESGHWLTGTNNAFAPDITLLGRAARRNCVNCLATI